MKESRQKISEASESHPSYQDWAERLRFETLLTDLSSRFCTIPPQDVDSEIDSTLRRVCENLG